jgi:hypothetical protein
MRNTVYLLTIVFVSVFGLQSCQSQSMVRDYTGATTNLVPKGWTISTSQEDGNYYWLAKENNSDHSPRLLQIIVPDQDLTPKVFQHKILSNTIDQIKIKQELQVSPHEAHYTLSGKIGQQTTSLASLVVRDPGKYYFLTVFAASPDEFDQWGGQELLYKCLQVTNPFTSGNQTSTPSPPAQGPSKDMSVADLNMQDISIKTEMIQRSTPVKKEHLIGKWIQVFGYPTQSVAQYTTTGELMYGSRGQAHLIEFFPNGQYTLSYLYDSVNGVCKNRSEVKDKGTYTLSGKQLTLKSNGYSAKLVVCGSPSNESKKKVPSKVFTVGIHPRLNHLSLFGPPFDFSVNTSYDDKGQEYILEGFTRVN